jgi:hypothetical protein
MLTSLTTQRKRRKCTIPLVGLVSHLDTVIRLVISPASLGKEVHVLSWDDKKSAYRCRIIKITKIIYPLNDAVIQGKFYSLEKEADSYVYSRELDEESWHWPHDEQLHQYLMAFNAQTLGDRIKIHDRLEEEKR